MKRPSRGEKEASEAGTSSPMPRRGSLRITHSPLTRMEVVRRSEAIKVPCPTCGAAEQTPCQGRRGDRISFHIDRHQAYIKQATEDRIARE